jgi:hypothetical protein
MTMLQLEIFINEAINQNNMHLLLHDVTEDAPKCIVINLFCQIKAPYPLGISGILCRQPLLFQNVKSSD